MRIIHIIAASFVLIAVPAFAKDGARAWIVAQKSGDVQVLHNGKQPASLQLRASLLAGDIIATGANGRAMLTNGDDYVVVAPGSRLLLPKAEEQSGFTRLLQQVGTMFYKVRHTGVPHFAVETPMLAAVVKGTSFSVVVDQNRAAVQVTDGVVEVSSLSGDARRLVERGLTVYIGRERPNEIIEMKPGSTVPPASGGKDEGVKVERSGDVSLSTVVSLAGGLVKEAAPVVVATNTVTADVLTSSGAPLPTTDVVKGVVPSVTVPAIDDVDTTVPATIEPVADVVGTIVDPVVDIVDNSGPSGNSGPGGGGNSGPGGGGNTVPAIVDPVVDIVDNTVTDVVAPVVDIVDNTVPAVVQPVVDIVDTSGPVVAPVVDVVDNTVTGVTQQVGGLLGGLTGGLFGKP